MTALTTFVKPNLTIQIPPTAGTITHLTHWEPPRLPLAQLSIHSTNTKNKSRPPLSPCRVSKTPNSQSCSNLSAISQYGKKIQNPRLTEFCDEKKDFSAYHRSRVRKVRRIQPLHPTSIEKIIDFLMTTKRLSPDFHLLSPLGKGHFGQVFPITPNSVIKILESQTSPKNGTRGEPVGLGIAHPYLVEILECFYESKGKITTTFVPQCKVLGVRMRRIHGTSLKKMISFKPSFNQIHRWCGQIASALKYLHDQGIGHFDVDAENILISETSDAVLLDFGLTKKDDSDPFHVSPLALGRPLSLPPSFQKGERPTLAFDAWSFGVLLYEMLHGKKPFQTRQAVFNGELQIDRSVPQCYRALIEGLLNRDESRRLNMTEAAEFFANQEPPNQPAHSDAASSGDMPD